MTTVGVRGTPAGTAIDLRVMPRAPRAGLGGTRDGRLLVRVTAPPVDHAANEAAIVALARALGVPRRAVRIVAGHRSRNKTAEITGLDPAQVTGRLASAGAPPRDPSRERA